MAESSENPTTENSSPIAFKAETSQLLNILIHSLYTEHEIFLRELVSNASDALTRVDFELLTNRDVLDPDVELSIRIIPNQEENTLTIEDTGIGMTAEEMETNLGTIAQSGAREFISAATESGGKTPEGVSLSELIGQFGVGFYSAFMVAEIIKVTSRSFKKDSQAATWTCSGSDTFTIEPAEKEKRGTSVYIKLKSEASEFTQEHRLREIIQRHSDFIPFPIYIGDEKEQVNRQTAIWRQQPREVEEKEYEDFYQQLTLDFEPPLTHIHMTVDAPAQMYAILFLPANPERSMFSKRKEDGLKLYARKVLIQEYNKDLLPEYLGFMQGVVDSEDLPLNVSRESVQSTRVMSQLKKIVTTKVIDSLVKLSQDDEGKFNQFWDTYARFIKQGIAIEPENPEVLYPLLRFHTTGHQDKWISLDDYVENMKADQKDIYYIMGDDDHSVMYSPHLDVVRHHDYEVILMTDPVDAFMLVRLDKYKDFQLTNVAVADLAITEGEEDKLDEGTPSIAEEDYSNLIDRFKDQLGESVSEVRMTDRLADSPARLVDPEGALNQEMQRVYRLLDRDFEVPKKVLELNPRHSILLKLNALPKDDSLSPIVVQQIFEDALLIEGLHPDPAGMIARIQKLMEKALV